MPFSVTPVSNFEHTTRQSIGIFDKYKTARFGMGVKSPALGDRDRRHAHALACWLRVQNPGDIRFRFEKSWCMWCYRLLKTTVGVHQEASRPVAISIPAGSFLRVPDGIANAAGLVEVEWDGETVQVFAVDLRDRGELFKAMSATTGAE